MAAVKRNSKCYTYRLSIIMDKEAATNFISNYLEENKNATLKLKPFSKTLKFLNGNENKSIMMENKSCSLYFRAYKNKISIKVTYLSKS